MRVLVTGGTGYLGRVLVHECGRRAHDVHAAWHNRLPDPHPWVEWHSGDLRDVEAVRQLVLRLTPDVVFHTAYVASGPHLDRVTADASGAIAESSAKVGARLVHLSTDVVFDGTRPAGDRYVETDDINPVTDYGRAKGRAEALVSEACPDALVVRTALIYGGAEPGPQEHLVRRALDGDEGLAFFTDELRCPIQVDDLARALMELAATPVTGPIHVAGHETVSRHEFAWLLAGSMGDSGTNGADGLRRARSADLTDVRPQNCALDSSLAQSLITTKLRGAREVLAS